ncbi:MAG: hypothetical protein V3V62_06785 [bacterium]
MSGISRRGFLRRGALGFAALGAGALILREGAAPTEASGDLGDYAEFLAARGENPAAPGAPASTGERVAAASLALTEENPEGPFYRPGAPFRAKITPPLEPGPVLLIRGRVWGHESRKPLAGAVLDIWQANAGGRYDNGGSGSPLEKGAFRNRARLIADETGHYEFETIHPGRYRIGAGAWRPSHIHYLIRHPGHRSLVTQLYFEGDPMNAHDPYVKKSLIIPLREAGSGARSHREGTFDIVLAPSRKA